MGPAAGWRLYPGAQRGVAVKPARVEFWLGTEALQGCVSIGLSMVTSVRKPAVGV